MYKTIEILDLMQNDVFVGFVTIGTSMLHENRNRKQLQILAKYSGSCNHATQQNVIIIRSITYSTWPI
jgi:hypothetical protein